MTVFNDYTIQDCCEILNNKRSPLNSEERDTIKGQYPYYGANGIQGYIDKYMLDGKLILMAEDGGYFDEYATKPIAYQVEGKCWVNNHAHVLKAKEGFEQDYIFYSLVHKNITPVIKGGTRSKLNLSELKQIVLPLPTIPIQQKIAKILSTIDGQIEKTEAIIAKYQAVKQGMLQDLFTRGIDVTTCELRPRYEDAPELYKDSALGKIPKEWEVDVLDSQIFAVDAQPDHRTPASVEGGIPYLGINDIDEYGSIDYRKCRKVSEQILKEQSNRYKLRDDDIIFGKIGTIGQPKRLKAWDRITISANVILIQPKENAAFIYWLLVSELINTQVNNTIHTTSQPAFGMEKIRSLKVVVPSNDERHKIAFMLDQEEKLISSEKTNLMKLNKIKQGLMSDLLSGKVEVTL